MTSRLIELVSTASLNVYPNNTVASFTTLLPENMVLDGEWEVGLLELSYPSRCLNVTEGLFRLYPYNADPGGLLDGSIDYNVAPGVYESIDELIDEMNDLSKTLYSDAHVSAKSINRDGTLSLWFHTECIFEPISKDMIQIFGYQKNIHRPLINIGIVLIRSIYLDFIP